MSEERLSIIRLSRTKSFSSTMFFKLLETYKSAANIVNNIESISKKIQICSSDNIKLELEECEKLDIKIITYFDDIYPEYLKNIDSPPLTLSCRGNLELFNNERKLAIIGSRNCSINNFNFARRIAEEVSNYGYVVVSGMAKGVDTASHLGSIKNGTIAVLGGGVDNVYPRENEYLYNGILENNGLIISEFPLHSMPKADHFPMRNRIIAGLSRGVLIVDAGLISGTLHTANQALKFGREVMAFPGNPYDERCAGSNKLLQQGATLVIDTKDIVECLETFIPVEVFKDNIVKFSYTNAEDDYKKYDFFDINKEDIEKLDIENSILSKLDFVPVEIESLFEQINNFPISEINSEIMKMRLMNKIIFDSGKISLKI